MKQLMRFCCLSLFFIALGIGCSGSGGGTTAVAPTVPSLAAAGSLNKISLTWTESSGGDLSGYNVYRSVDGNTFTEIASAVTGTTYDDTIASPAGDGVFYYYQVTAVGQLESARSNTVKNIHGTRVSASLPSGLTTSAPLSPYIVEGSVVSEGSVVVATGTKLYVLDDGTLDILAGNALSVSGLMQILATTTAPATLTSHGVGVPLGADEGFHMLFSGCESYTTGGNGGTILQNARILNLSSGGAVGSRPIEIHNCSPKFSNLHLSANNGTQAAYMMVWQDSGGMVMQHCSLTGFYVELWGDKRPLQFQMDHNLFDAGDWNYALSFVLASAPQVNAGQIENNAFHVTGQLNVGSVYGGGTFPLGNNYWSTYPAEPSFRNQNASDCLPDFAPMLSAAPAGAGPTW